MLDVVYAFSATPSDHRTYHPKIIMSQQSSLLIESQIIHYLKTKQTKILKSSSIQLKPSDEIDFIVNQALFAHPNACAFIDCGARLRGLNNLQAAERFAFLAKGKKDFRYILFYQEDALFAYDTSKDIHQTPTQLSNTDPDTIKNELNNCLPEQRYTYYDQDHITGSDILQPAHGVAIVTVDLQTGISTFLQADGRMRGLDKAQEIIIVIPPELEKILKEIDPLESLLNIMRTNQRLQLEIDHFQAALKSVRNFYREDLLSRLLQQPTVKARDALFAKSIDFFIEKQSDNIIKMYQQRSELQDIGLIMNSISQDTRKLWLLAVSDQPQEQIILADQVLVAKTARETEKAILICKAKESFPPPQWGKQVQAQQQVQTQAQAQMQKQMQQENAVYYSSQNINAFDFKWIDNLEPTADRIFSAVTKHFQFQSILSQGQSLEIDPHIYATNDFLTHTVQQRRKNFYNNTLNPQPCVFLATDSSYRNITLLLLSAEEANRLNNRLTSNPRQYCWFSTYDGYTFPEASYPSHIQAQINLLLEQAAFLTGRIDYLSATKNLNWLRKKPEEKLTFFRAVIQPAYNISESNMSALSNSLMKLDSQHLMKWSDPNLDTGQVNTWKLSLPLTLRKRLDKIIPYLEELRITALVTHKTYTAQQLMDEGIIENDAQLVEDYGKSLLAHNDYFASALFMMQNPQTRVRQFINASLENLPNSLINATMIAVAISSRQPALVWLKDFVEDMHYLYGKIDLKEPFHREILNFLYDSDLLDTFSLRTSYQTKKLEALVALWQNDIEDVESIKALLKKPDMNFITRLAEHKALTLKIVNQALQAENLLLPQFSEYLLTLSQNNLLFPWSAQKVFQDEYIWPATQAYIESRLTEPKILLHILNNARFAQLIAQLCQNQSYNAEDLVRLLKSSLEQLEILQGTLQSLQNFGFEINANTITAAQKPALNKALTILHNLNKSVYSKNRVDTLHAKAIIQSILNKPNLSLSLNLDLLDYCSHEQQIAFISGMIKSASVQDLHNLIQTNYLDSLVTNNLSLISYLSEIDPTIFINLFERAAMGDLALVVNKWLGNKTIDFEESPELFHILIEKDPLWVIEQTWNFNTLHELKQTFEQVRNYIYKPTVALQAEQSADNFLHYLKSHIPIQDQEMKEEKSSPSPKWQQVLQESRQYVDNLIQKSPFDSIRQLHQKNKDRLVALQLRLVSETKALDDILAISQVRNISDRDIKHILSLIFANQLENRYSTFMVQYYDLRSEQVTKNILNQVSSILASPSHGLFAVNSIYQKVFDSLTSSLMKKIAVYAIVTSENADFLLKSRVANCFDADFDKAVVLLKDDIMWNLQSQHAKVGWDLVKQQLISPMQQLFRNDSHTHNQIEALVEIFNKMVTPGLAGPKI